MVPGRGDDDPLSLAMAPPPNESEADRAARMRAETEAKKVSDAIDEELQQDQRNARKNGKPMKLLLLGQSESGKSTTLKNFQILHSQKAFRSERASWRAVILLNVVRSIRLILDAIGEVQNLRSGRSSPERPGAASPSPSISPPGEIPELSADHMKLRMRLLPLLQIEQVLIRKLTSAGSGQQEATQLPLATNGRVQNAPKTNKDKEFAVYSQFQWKGMFNRLVANPRESFESDAVDWQNPEDPGRLISALREDIIRLWSDPMTHKVLEYKKLRLEDMPGFFLDSLDRITSPRYVPTDEDILRARLKTLGVTEYRFQLKDERMLGLTSSTKEWRVYDVGGQRSLRAAWIPFFDDMNAILFLAPISCFDQVLEEDPTVNRLEDSVLLWKTIIQHKLLAKTAIILFLNKTDILKQKLKAGIQFSDFVVTYGTRPNDFTNVSNYMKRKFSQIHKDHSPEPRPFYCHFTTVTDTKATCHLLTDVQDTIIRRQLQDSKLVV